MTDLIERLRKYAENPYFGSSAFLFHEAATALATERERAEKAEKERDEARGWAKDWQQIIDATCTVLELGALDPPRVVEAIRSKFEAAESSLAEARRLLKPFGDIAEAVFYNDGGREMNSHRSDDAAVWGFDRVELTYGHLRGVRRFLAQESNDGR
jgi:hypothetical protein